MSVAVDLFDELDPTAVHREHFNRIPGEVAVADAALDRGRRAEAQPARSGSGTGAVRVRWGTPGSLSTKISPLPGPTGQPC